MADVQDKDSLIQNFSTVAGVDPERARFFLESAAWNLDLALTSFFEADEESDDEVVPQPKAPTPPRSTTVEQTSRAGAAGKSQGSAPQGRKQAKPSTTSSRFVTINSLRDRQAEESEESEEEGQAYYAGGSEQSGQQIIGPAKKKPNQNQMITGLFSAARSHGAEEMDTSPSSSARPDPFQGRAYRLGGPDSASEVVEGPRVEQKKMVRVTLKLWKNGFSLDDGPMRGFDDPRNMAFLESIRQNELPRELVEQARGGEVSLSMEDHRNEDFAASKKAVQSFSGAGHRLGSPTDANQGPTIVSAGSVPAATASAAAAAAAAAFGSEAGDLIDLDASQPTTSIQIRLSDGSRLVAKFNHTHRISDVRRYIISSRPQFAGTNFVLMTTFPNKELTDESETLKAANLLNAVLVQKMK